MNMAQCLVNTGFLGMSCRCKSRQTPEYGGRSLICVSQYLTCDLRKADRAEVPRIQVITAPLSVRDSPTVTGSRHSATGA